MEIDLLSKDLDGGRNPRLKLCASCSLEVFEEILECCLAKIPQKPALAAEEDAQHLGDDKYDLAVRDIQNKPLPHPLPPLLKPLGVARWTKSTAANCSKWNEGMSNRIPAHGRAVSKKIPL